MGFIDSSVVAVNNGLTEIFNFSHTSVGSPSWIRPDNPADAFNRFAQDGLQLGDLVVHLSR